MKRFDQDQRGSTVSVDPLGNPERGFSGPLRTPPDPSGVCWKVNQIVEITACLGIY
jgi:hypothetical protein